MSPNSSTDRQQFSLKFLQIILAYCNKDRIGVLSFSVIVFLFVLPHAVHTYLQWTENIFKGPFTFHKNSTYILYFLCIFIIYLAHQFQNYASILFTNICQPVRFFLPIKTIQNKQKKNLIDQEIRKSSGSQFRNWLLDPVRRIFIIKIIQHKNYYFLTFPASF